MSQPEKAISEDAGRLHEWLVCDMWSHMPGYVKAAILYVAVVFAAAFLLGALRVSVVVPMTGALLAVALEVPVVLGLSWIVAGRVLRRWPLPLGGRIAMGGIAFVLLMLAEMALAVLFGQTLGQFLAAMATPPGALGLAGQIGFAAIPALRGRGRSGQPKG